jgi:hypothetical protein
MSHNTQRRNQQDWKNMSVDFRLMFAYHGSMMVLMMAGVGLSLQQEVLIVVALVAVLVSIAVRHRARNGWHWPGANGKDVLTAIGTAIFVAFFLFGATPLFPIDSQVLPWYLAGAGIGTFGILSALKIASGTETDFMLHCTVIDQYGQEIPRLCEIPKPRVVEARWKKMARGAYFCAFMLVWIAGVLSFYAFGVSFKNGSPVPTATQTQPLQNHGKTVYVTPAEKQRIDRLQVASWLSIPVILFGLFLHFIVGVKLYDNAPTLFEYLKLKRSGT